jgi:hypothetical protein
MHLGELKALISTQACQTARESIAIAGTLPRCEAQRYLLDTQCVPLHHKGHQVQPSLQINFCGNSVDVMSLCCNICCAIGVSSSLSSLTWVRVIRWGSGVLS